MESEKFTVNWCGGDMPGCLLLCAQDAVKAGHLKSATYQRLLVGVIAKSSLYLAAFMLVSERVVFWRKVLATSKHLHVASRARDNLSMPGGK